MRLGRSEGARIAVLDPAMRTREYGRRAVRRLGHQPKAFASTAELAPEFDMVFLAVEGDAESALLQLAEVKALVGRGTPVLCLASRDQVPVLSDSHWNAANDVIVRPTSFVEFCCVARMFMRRFGVHVHESDPTWDCYRFSLMSDAVEVSGERVHLRATEVDVAFELFSHAGQTLTREWLYSTVWDKYEDTQSRTLDVCISRLRRVLDLRANGWDLRAVHGMGYRLDGPAGEGRGIASREAEGGLAKDASIAPTPPGPRTFFTVANK
jgi:DNA-binding response OmpR family regulator